MARQSSVVRTIETQNHARVGLATLSSELLRCSGSRPWLQMYVRHRTIRKSWFAPYTEGSAHRTILEEGAHGLRV